MRRGAARVTGSRTALAVAGSAAVVAALVADLTGDHPTHLAVTMYAAVIMWLLCRRLSHGPLTARAIMVGALLWQPLVHLGSPSDASPEVGPYFAGGIGHILGSTVLSVGMQIAVPAVVLMVLTALAHLLGLLLKALHPAVFRSADPVGTTAAPSVTLDPVHRHSRLHECGWVIIAARRGPPVGALPVTC